VTRLGRRQRYNLTVMKFIDMFAVFRQLPELRDHDEARKSSHD
jgi:hypothetical protein